MSPDPQTPTIEVGEAARLAALGQVLLLDVREPHEWAAGHADAAVHLPLGEVGPTAVARDRPVLVICRSGNRSGKATVALNGAGIDARNVTGGMQAWAAAGFPVVRDDGQPGDVA